MTDSKDENIPYYTMFDHNNAFYRNRSYMEYRRLDKNDAMLVLIVKLWNDTFPMNQKNVHTLTVNDVALLLMKREDMLNVTDEGIFVVKKDLFH